MICVILFSPSPSWLLIASQKQSEPFLQSSLGLSLIHFSHCPCENILPLLSPTQTFYQTTIRVFQLSSPSLRHRIFLHLNVDHFGLGSAIDSFTSGPVKSLATILFTHAL